MPIPTLGSQVQDTWYPEISGKVVEITKSRFRIKLDYPEAVPRSWYVPDSGIVSYDY